MRNYEITRHIKSLLTPEIVSLLTQIHEYRGQQNLFVEAHADQLTELLEIAKIQSTEASNKIEGIQTSDARLKSIVLEKTMPQTRSEQEIAGYRDVLKTIHESHDYIPLQPSMILQLHRDLCKFSGKEYGGTYKNTDNFITELDANGEKRIRFVPVSAWETPPALDAACKAYNDAIAEDTDELLAIPIFILDFLCIHPFTDGNGRMSRLLTLLLLYRCGYLVGKYISIERVIERSKETYYEALQFGSQGWHENANDYAPFVRYLLGVILAAYRDFSSRVQLLSDKKLSKPERISHVIRDTLGKITKVDIRKKCPDISLVTIQRTLSELQKSGAIIKLNGGRYAAYIWNRENEK